MNEKPAFWFPVKAYGWGWGPPVRWQGWVVLGLYFVLIGAGIHAFAPQGDVVALIVSILAATVALVAIVVAKGERPVGWRWGKRR
jgi:hypothetical protein